MGGGSSESRIIARQEVGEDRIRFLERARVSSPQFADEAILEDVPEALNVAFTWYMWCSLAAGRLADHNRTRVPPRGSDANAPKGNPRGGVPIPIPHSSVGDHPRPPASYTPPTSYGSGARLTLSSVAWGEAAGIQRMSSSARARPSCVRGRRK